MNLKSKNVKYEEAFVVQNLVSDLSGSLVPEALESREDGGKGAKMKNFRKFKDLLIFLRSKNGDLK